MARRYRRNETITQATFSISPRPSKKKGKPITREVIAKYLKILALEEGAERVGSMGEAAAARTKRLAMEDTYPGIAERAKGKKAATSRTRPAYTSESASADLAEVAKKAAKKARDLRKHKVVVTMPDGSKFEAKGYATIRAANIDAKKMVLAVKKVFQRNLGLAGGFPVSVERDSKGEESGYSWGQSLGARTDALRRNPFLRHNTHLPVGTTVDYKGKRAKVTAQHDRDVYTVRFASTGKTMRVPGFLLDAV